jgi:hypothetical protein
VYFRISVDVELDSRQLNILSTADDKTTKRWEYKDRKYTQKGEGTHCKHGLL